MFCQPVFQPCSMSRQANSHSNCATQVNKQRFSHPRRGGCVAVPSGDVRSGRQSQSGDITQLLLSEVVLTRLYDNVDSEYWLWYRMPWMKRHDVQTRHSYSRFESLTTSPHTGDMETRATCMIKAFNRAVFLFTATVISRNGKLAKRSHPRPTKASGAQRCKANLADRDRITLLKGQVCT
jgi:hypothetical protein